MRVRLICLLLLLCTPMYATQIRGTLLDASTRPLLGGKLVLELSTMDDQNIRQAGCGAGSAPVVQGPVGVLGSWRVPVKAGVGGVLIGSVVGSDQINCGAGYGVGVFYHVTAYDSYGVVSWEKDSRVTGGLWTPQSAAWLNILPPPALGAPTTANSPCLPPQWAYDSSYLYLCTGPSSWKRTPLSVW